MAKRLAWVLLLFVCFWCGLLHIGFSIAHDLPNSRVDRSTQLKLIPRRLLVNYEVSLSELTLAQDLNKLDGESFDGDRTALFERYARVVGPLNARGILLDVDLREIDLQPLSFEILYEGHLRILFHFEAEIPERGRLSLHDTNYQSSEGTTRLALRVDPGLEVTGRLPPAEITSIPLRSSWELSDLEEQATKRCSVQYVPSTSKAVSPLSTRPPTKLSTISTFPSSFALTRLLDDANGAVGIGWLVTAFFLGMVHAIQPGHGKSLVAVASVGGSDAVTRGVLLGLITAACHLIGVMALAFLLWSIQTTRFEAIHIGVVRTSGFIVSAVGLFRLGRNLARMTETHLHRPRLIVGSPGLWLLGIAGGFVPCWDGVALVVLASSIGQLSKGVVLLIAFTLGLAVVLVSIGGLANWLRFDGLEWITHSRAQRWLGIGSGLLLAIIGLNLLHV